MVVGILPHASGHAADEFYKGRTITLYVGYSPGGGYDVAARNFARYAPKHIPGSPTFVMKNMPGAGSIRLSNHMFNVASKDGTEIAAVGREIPTATLHKVKNAQFRSDQFNWIGSLASGTTFCVAWHEAPLKKPQDLLTIPFIVAASGGQSPTVGGPILINNLLGTNIKIISGYSGGSAMHLAMERGEVQGRCAVTISSINSSRPDWIRDGKVRFLIELSIADKRKLPDVPRIVEFTKTDEQRQQLEVLLAPEDWQRPLLAPPGVPNNRVADLRAAFDKTVADPAYVAEVERQKLAQGALAGVEIEKRVKKLQALPEKLVDSAMKIASERTRTSIEEVAKQSGKK